MCPTKEAILVLVHTSARDIAIQFRQECPMRILGGYYMFIGTGLATTWILIWAAFVFAGRPTPVEEEYFRV